MRPEDDRFHPPVSDDPWWTETCWFSFGDPRLLLSGTFYPLFRKNLGVAALGVAVWDAAAHEPWRVPYHRTHWHLPWPSGDLDDLSLAGLRYETLEPGRRYRVRYRDGDRLDVDLEYHGLVPAHEIGVAGGHGHLDQPCRFEGVVSVGGRRHEVSGYDMRDRSWQVRADDRSTRGGYTYGIAGPRDAFLALSFRTGAEEHTVAAGDRTAGAEHRVAAGFLLRDGEKADLAGGVRRVERGAEGWPTRVVIEARDARGRELVALGETRTRLAHQASPGLFAWMSFTAWDFAGGCHGQDQDIWSPDALAGAAVR
jgi:hypothetical protein